MEPHPSGLWLCVVFSTIMHLWLLFAVAEPKRPDVKTYTGGETVIEINFLETLPHQYKMPASVSATELIPTKETYLVDINSTETRLKTNMQPQVKAKERQKERKINKNSTPKPLNFKSLPVLPKDKIQVMDLHRSHQENKESSDTIKPSRIGPPPPSRPKIGEEVNLKQNYIDENFIYIKELIARNLAYPHLARRLKWQGIVLVSFVVMKDGLVKNIQIERSSGRKILDEHAVETVQRTLPFPNPPVEAKIILPIKYILSR